MNEIMYDILIDDIANIYNVDRKIVEIDFVRFSAEIDRVIEEEGLSKEDAIAKVWSYWVVPFVEKDNDIKNLDVDED